MLILENPYYMLILGIVIGVYGYTALLNYENKKWYKEKYKIPLDDLVSRGLDIYEFSRRQGDFVTLAYDGDTKSITLNIIEKTITVFHGKKAILFSINYYQKEFDSLYNSLEEKFNKEIYIDIITIDNYIYSKNMISEQVLEHLNELDAEKEKEKIFELDDILDKIHNEGIASLSDEENDFLERESR